MTTIRFAVLTLVLALMACSSAKEEGLFAQLAPADSGASPVSDGATGVVDAGAGDAQTDVHDDAAAPSEDADVDGGAVDAAPPSSDAGPDTSQPPPLNGCKESDFVDYRTPAADRIVHFPDALTAPDGAALPLEYSPRCMRVQTGQSVTWKGDFGVHTLAGSDNNPLNPIPANGVEGTGGAYTVKFGAPGRYGYECQQHAAMRGAIDVTP